MVDPAQGSPEWWLRRLHTQLTNREARYTLLGKYASGDHPLPEGSDKWAKYYRAWQKRSRTNYCGLAAGSVAERLQVDGFRSGADGDPQMDRLLWSWWQANHLDADSDMVHATASERSDAYVIVGLDPAGRPLITPEQPEQVITATDPTNRRVVTAALKTWTVDSTAYARLYLPGSVIRYEANVAKWVNGYRDWHQVGDVEPLPIVSVPVVRFVNRPRLTGEGLAEFEDATDVQDRINTITLHLLTISQSQAFRQRYVKGLPTEDENGNPIDPPFEALVSALWSVEDTDVQFGEFQQVDLSPLLDALQSAVTAFITVTGLPPHYVAGDLVNASADALAAAESRLVAKVRNRQRSYGESWEQVMQLAGEWTGTPLGADIEVQWHDPERKTSAQLADATLKAGQAGVPWAERMAMLQYSPQDITRMAKSRADDAAEAATLAVGHAATAMQVDHAADPQP